MSNNQQKKHAAKVHNKLRAEKLARELCRKENPAKYHLKKHGKGIVSAMMFIGVSALITTLIN